MPPDDNAPEAIILTNTTTEEGGVDGPRSVEVDRNEDFVESVKIKIGQYRTTKVADGGSIYYPSPDKLPSPNSQEKTFLGDLLAERGLGVQAAQKFNQASNSGLIS